MADGWAQAREKKKRKRKLPAGPEMERRWAGGRIRKEKGPGRKRKTLGLLINKSRVTKGIKEKSNELQKSHKNMFWDPHDL